MINTCTISNNNPGGYCWYDWLIPNNERIQLKEWEGRINNGKWKQDFDVLEVKCRENGKTTNFLVLEKRVFVDFNEAYEKLGSKLIPIGLPFGMEDANELYESFGYDPETVKRFGVVCVHLKKI